MKVTQLFFILVCISGLLFCLTYAQGRGDSYRVVFDRIVGRFLHPDILSGNITTRKYNRTMATASTFLKSELQTNFGDVEMRAQGYQFLSNTYRLSFLRFNFDLCMLMGMQMDGKTVRREDGINAILYDTVKGILNDTNVPTGCPAPPGFYYIRNSVISINLKSQGIKLPSNFMGKWKLSMDFVNRRGDKTESLVLADLYCTAVEIPQW